MSRALVVVAFGVLAGAVGYLMGSRPPQPVAVEAPRPVRALQELIPNARPVVFDADFWRELRLAVREEVRAAEGARQVAPEVEVREPTFENDATYQRAVSLVSSAISARRWGREDAARLRTLRSGMTGPQYADLMKTLLPAINDRQLEVEASLF